MEKEKKNNKQETGVHEVIGTFDGKYRFLSNFWPCVIHYQGGVYMTTEHAYQAAKTLDQGERWRIANCSTPGQAKKLGNMITLRADWEDVKLQVMYDICWEKFNIPELKEALIGTGDRELIEGNWWNDVYWGMCRGKGENHLGKILMDIRYKLK